MMGRSHALSGLSVGVLLAGALDHAPSPVRLLVIPVVGGAALLPDLDHPRATAARSLGALTRWIARVVNDVGLALYHATRAQGDPKDKRDGHRLVTHTIPGCLAPGVPSVAVHTAGSDLAGSLGIAPEWAARIPAIWGAISVGICLGLLARTSARIGALFTLGGTVATYLCATAYPSWWWVWPAATVLGCLTHVLGDGCTVAGVPVYWPIAVQTDRGPQRWYAAAIPGVAFSAGSGVETEVVVPLLWVALASSVGIASGVLPALVGSLWEIGQGWWA